jgi:Cyclic nucleotide-binding domain
LFLSFHFICSFFHLFHIFTVSFPSAKKVKGQDVKPLLRSLVRTNLLLRRLKSSAIDKLVAAMQRKPVREGRYIVHEGDRGDYFYLVEEGAVDVLQKLGQTYSFIVTLTRGASFGIHYWKMCGVRWKEDDG